MTNGEWATIKRVKGPSVRAVFYVEIACLAAIGVLLLTFLVIAFATDVPFDRPLPISLLALMAALFVGLLLLIELTKKMAAREMAAGYTTSVVGFTHVQQIDPGTGVVVREAGKPLLNHEERREQARRVKQFKQANAE
jgi:hypothetical protein